MTTTTERAPGTVTRAELEAIAAAARAWFAESAHFGDDYREWSDPATGRRYAAAMRDARAWVHGGAVHARVRRFDYTATSALEAGISATPAATGRACYLTERAGTHTAHFGTDAARELARYQRTHPGATFPGGTIADAPEVLAAWLGEDSTDPAYLAALYAAYRAGIDS